MKISLKTYALVLVASGVVVLATAGVRISQTTNSIVEQYVAANQQFANNEAMEALRIELTSMENVAKSYAVWDETVPNFYNPRYYTHWRDVRAAQLPSGRGSVMAVELYRASGESLSAERNVLLQSKFPPKLQELKGLQTGLGWLSQESGRVVAYMAYPVSYVDTRLPVGYVTVKAPIEEVLQGKRYRYIKDGSFRFKEMKHGEFYLPERSEGHIVVDAVSNSEVTKLSDVNKKAVLQYSILVIAYFVAVAAFSFMFLLRPLRKLAMHFRKAGADGDNQAGTVLKGTQVIQEIAEFVASVDSYRHRLRTLHDRLSSQNRMLEDMAYKDALTGVNNRRALELFVQDIRDNPEHGDKPVSLVLIDCDHFKAINDTYGHEAGDKVLISIAKAAGEVLRHNDRLFRLGGDEFVVILPGADAAAAVRASERIYDAVGKVMVKEYGIPDSLVVSIGVATEPKAAGADFERLKSHADVAMYEAKRRSGKKVVLYNASMDKGSSVVSSKTIHRVVDALDGSGTIEMHYQQIVPIYQEIVPLDKAGAPGMVEALMRIRNGNSLLSPQEIFPVVELKRLEVSTDIAVLRAVTRDIADGVVPEGFGITINVHPDSLSNPNFIDQLRESRTAINGRDLVLEITETAMVEDFQGVGVKLAAVRDLGYRIALDDFGGGYSSIQHLTSLPIDMVKFDRSLISSLTEEKSRFVTAKMAGMMREMGYLLVAEGVESEECLVSVHQLGFQYAQGFYFSKPARFQNRGQLIRLEELLKRRRNQ